MAEEGSVSRPAGRRGGKSRGYFRPSLNDFNRSLAEYNRSLEARLEAGRTPALEAQVKILETEIDLPEIFTFSPRQVAAKRKELLQVYEELAGRLTGEAADEVLLKIDKLRALMREKAAR